jgi:Ni,Fe-hydrogenase I cytochrome b subunit
MSSSGLLIYVEPLSSTAQELAECFLIMTQSSAHSDHQQNVLDSHRLICWTRGLVCMSSSGLLLYVELLSSTARELAECFLPNTQSLAHSDRHHNALDSHRLNCWTRGLVRMSSSGLLLYVNSHRLNWWTRITHAKQTQSLLATYESW